MAHKKCNKHKDRRSKSSTKVAKVQVTKRRKCGRSMLLKFLVALMTVEVIRIFLTEIEPPPPSLTTGSHTLLANKEQTTMPSQDSVLSHRPHPHAGAKDAQGKLGFVEDPSPARLGTFEWQNQAKWPCSNTRLEGIKASAVLQKIRGGILTSREELKHVESNKMPKILCLVYTVDMPAPRRNMEAVVSTWGKRCDGFIAGSNVTDASIGAVNILHAGPESYDNMWQKVRSVWTYAHDNYLDQFDYFHICGDDVYVMMDNFRAYFLSEDIDRLLNGHIDILGVYQECYNRDTIIKSATNRPRPLLLGHPRRYMRKQMFPYGGPGYTLNRAALKSLVEFFDSKETVANNAVDSREDVFMGEVMRSLGVTIADTRDSDHAWRYMEHDAHRMFIYDNKPFKRIDASMNLGGINEVSKQTVAVHLKLNRVYRKHPRGVSETDLVHRYEQILEGQCPE